ncbi:uncharacterized protein TNCV_3163591 [Trichonephila clavipes]|nr:uncharacterized protein TNCV_3163591 [Trichonephila clavipes]
MIKNPLSLDYMVAWCQRSPNIGLNAYKPTTSSPFWIDCLEIFCSFAKETVFEYAFQECEEEDVEARMTCNAEDCVFQMLNDGEIVTSMQEKSDPFDDEDNNHNESSKRPSNADACSTLETSMEWYKQ